MANYRYYSDLEDGTTAILKNVYSMDNAEFAARFPGIIGKRSDSFSKLVGKCEARDWQVLPLTRSVIYKSNPSKHECDARCTGARGRTMNCECSCGGKNHGKHA